MAAAVYVAYINYLFAIDYWMQSDYFMTAARVEIRVDVICFTITDRSHFELWRKGNQEFSDFRFELLCKKNAS